MSNLAIKVEGISKAYRIGVSTIKKDDTLMSKVKMLLTKPLQNFKKVKGLSNISESNIADDDIYMALNNVSFELNKGEVLGIIGKNGAGKSTLLKVLSRIVQPTAGRAEMYGRVASLLEVGTGFNPDLTGNENIYLNGTILGLTKKEIDERYDRIVEFSGIAKFIETPVKRYSSGMKVRLAFAVAAHLEPEILIIDEVLAVGDAEFQKKCLGKLQEVAGKQGRTVLFVSHDMAAVKNLCTRAILMQQGSVIYQGSPNDVVDYYLQHASAANHSNEILLDNAKGSKKFIVDKVKFINENGIETPIAESGKDLEIKMHYQILEEGPDPVVILRIKNNLEQVLFTCLSRNSYHGVMRLRNTGTISCLIPKLPLLQGSYTVDMLLKFGQDVTFDLESAFTLEVETGDFFGTGKLNRDMQNGIITYHTWKVQ